MVSNLLFSRRPPPKVRHRRTACLPLAAWQLNRSPSRSVTLFCREKSKKRAFATPPPCLNHCRRPQARRPDPVTLWLDAAQRDGRPKALCKLLHGAVRPSESPPSSAKAALRPVIAPLQAWRSIAPAHDNFCWLCCIALLRCNSAHRFSCALRFGVCGFAGSVAVAGSSLPVPAACACWCP